MANNEKVQAALDTIEQRLAAINTDKDWLQYLDFQSRFYHYSARNILLIYAQRPEASYVKGFKAWHDLGRYVKKGSKGIAILAPCTRKVEVFKEPDEKNVVQDMALPYSRNVALERAQRFPDRNTRKQHSLLLRGTDERTDFSLCG